MLQFNSIVTLNKSTEETTWASSEPTVFLSNRMTWNLSGFTKHFISNKTLNGYITFRH